MTSVCDWCPRGISKEEKIHRGRPPPGETSRLLGNPLRQRRWRNLDSNYVENPCWFANSQGRERPELVVRSGNFICWNLLWPGLGVHFAFLPFFFFLVGEPPGREPPRCTSQSEEENFLVGLAPHPSLAGDASRDPVSLCRDKAGHLGVMELNSREGVSRHAGQRGEPARHCQCTHHKKRQQWNAGP